MEAEVAKLLAEEERSMHRPCRLLDSSVLKAEGLSIATVVYESEPIDCGNLGLQHQIRVAVSVDGERDSSMVGKTWFEKEKP